MRSFDVVIVGAGVVGMTTALALAQKTNCQIALIDTKEVSSTWKKESYDFRVSAISKASERIFMHLGVWDLILAKRVAAFKKMFVWDAEGKGKIEFDSANVKSDNLGSIIEDSVMRASCLEKISETDNIILYSPLKLLDLKKHADHIELIAHQPNAHSILSLQAKLVIAADGGNSWVREQANIESKIQDYKHVAIVSTVQTELPHESTAWQRFLTTGPLAFLPLPSEHNCSIVWSVPPALAKDLLALDDSAFCNRLENSFNFKLGKILTASQRYHFPLKMQHAKNYTQPRLALVGDAAHTIHPLAGLGVNMGLLDAACLVDVISHAIKKNRDFSSLATLRRFERWRKADNAILLTAVNCLKNIFMSESKPIKNFRTLGLRGVDHTDFLKNWFIHYAMGERSEMPELSQ